MAAKNTKKLDLNPVSAVDSIAASAKPPHKFEAHSPDELRKWQNKTRRELQKRLGFLDGKVAPSKPEVIESVSSEKVFEKDIFEGYHRINGDKTYSFLEKHL